MSVTTAAITECAGPAGVTNQGDLQVDRDDDRCSYGILGRRFSRGRARHPAFGRYAPSRRAPSSPPPRKRNPDSPDPDSGGQQTWELFSTRLVRTQ